MEESVCACDKCKSMCLKQPCIGTPEDIYKIIAAGHSNKLSLSFWLTGLVTDSHDKPVEMIQPKALEDGRCAFLDDNHLCTLHDAGLKPTEGKLAIHSEKPTGDFKETSNYKVAMTWIDENGYNNPAGLLMKAASKFESNGNK